MSGEAVRTALIVDDSPEDRETYKAFLEQAGDCAYRFLDAEDGEEALAICQRERVDLILLDYHLPTLDGLDVLDRLRAGEGEVDPPVVMLTGRGRENVAVRALKSGASDYLVKAEITPQSLAHVARNVVEKAELRRRLDAQRAMRESFEKHLMGMVSHDLRNPLQTLLFAATTLLLRDDLDARTRATVGRMLSSAERATRLVNDILDFTRARLGAGLPVDRKRFDLCKLARAVLDELEQSFDGRVIAFECRGDLVGDWDQDRTVQILNNLVTNAAKYSPAGTPVAVALHGEADRVVLRVHNLGPPIPPDALPTLFEPMTRAHKGGSGLGLGLYIVREIARAHGGSVEVQSTEPEGTTFTVVLPRAAASGS